MAVQLESPPFGIRAFMLAVAAFFIGLGALTLVLTRKAPAPLYVVPPSASSVAWPEGFVEWQELAAPSASAVPIGTGSAPPRPDGSAR